MSEVLEIGSINDIPVLGARVVKTKVGDIAVFRNAKNEVFALLDKCPHKGGPLSQGIVHGHSVTCPLHNWVLNLKDGIAKEPDVGCTQTYQIKIKGDTLFLSLSPNTNE